MVVYRSRLENFSGRVITAKTIERMHDLVRSAKQDWEWIELATWTVRGLPSKDYLGECRRVFDVFHALIWDIGSFRYIRDPHQVETVESPWALLHRRATDCDGWTVLFSSFAGAIGNPYRFKTINADLTRPESPSHVYAQVDIQGVGWVSADLTVKSADFGWEPEGYRFQLWPEPKY